MKITIEIIVDDELIEDPSIAQRHAERVFNRVNNMFEFEFRDEVPAYIETKWEFQKLSGTMTNERNPS